MNFTVMTRQARLIAKGPDFTRAMIACIGTSVLRLMLSLNVLAIFPDEVTRTLIILKGRQCSIYTLAITAGLSTSQKGFIVNMNSCICRVQPGVVVKIKFHGIYRNSRSWRLRPNAPKSAVAKSVCGILEDKKSSVGISDLTGMCLASTMAQDLHGEFLHYSIGIEMLQGIVRKMNTRENQRTIRSYVNE
jgi:hypothetical protein